MVLDKTVKVLVRGTDRYGRTLGIIFLDGRVINTELVRAGWAWHYVEYSDSKVLAQAEQEARKAKRGLWAGMTSPIAPWDWREQERARAARERASAKRAAEVEARKKILDKRRGGSENNWDNLGSGIAPVPPAASGSYWLTTSSGVRHNSGCRYYRKSKGRPCGKGEGRGCKICGG